LVTPELVAPLNPNQVTYVPGTDHRPPNDWELFALGQIDGATPPRAGPKNDEPSAGHAGEPTTTLRLRGPVGLAGGREGT
jgi:Flp pilus assembly secretin CpaC